MNSRDVNRTVLDKQQQHWEKMFTGNIDMFGEEPSMVLRLLEPRAKKRLP